MSTLRERLKRPELYLSALLILAGIAILDSLRSPGHQITAHLYIRAVETYQRVGRPLLAPYVRCRYRPTCSVYSAQAVRRFGIRAGLALTWRRIASCTASVPPGAVDPVPTAF